MLIHASLEKVDFSRSLTSRQLILPHRIGPSLGYGTRRTGDGKEALQAGGDRRHAAAG